MAHKFIKHLNKDHDEQRRLGKQLRKAKGSDEREALRQQFHEALYPHMVGEEASIFDFLTSAQGKAREEALRALQEHYVAKTVLREIMDLTLDSEIFNAKAYVLDEMNQHHMEEEEKTHFPMIERMASQEKMDSLFERYMEAEEEAKGS